MFYGCVQRVQRFVRLACLEQGHRIGIGCGNAKREKK
jgi:hypothetical protein